MTCPRCGAQIADGVRFCTTCDYEVLSPPTAPGGSAPMLETTTSDTAATSPTAPDEVFQMVKWELIKDYDVEVELGRGGMAIVYRAKEIDLGRTVALKVLPPEMSIGASMADRFKREARMAASLDHPNIIPVYRVGNAGRLLFIAMKYIEGRPLDSVIAEQGAFPVPVALHVLRGAAHALAYAHEHGIVHRDIKGANILIQKDGRPVVSDFGVARALEDKSMTATGAVIGTPYFMSPEQCAGKQVGPQTDQYSLGVVAFQLLTGTVPFDGDSLPAIMQHHWFTPVPDIKGVRDDVPKALLDIIYRALAKDPKQRYASTQELSDALDAVPLDEKDRQWGSAMLKELANGTPIPKVRTGSLPPLMDTMRLSQPSLRRIEAPERRRRRMLSLAATVGVAAILLSASGFWLAARSRSEAATIAARDSVARAALASQAPAVSANAGQGAMAQVDTGIGTLRIRGLPRGARVVIDGKTMPGSTMTLAAGAHDYTISASGYRSESGRIQVTASEVSTIEAALERAEPVAAVAVAETPAAKAPAPMPSAPSGKIRLRADPPDAEIFIDDRAVGRGVLVDFALAPGNRRLRISASGYATLDTTIVVRSGETTSLGRRTLQSETP